MMAKTIEELSYGSTKWTVFLNQAPRYEREKVMTASNSLEGERYDW